MMMQKFNSMTLLRAAKEFAREQVGEERQYKYGKLARAGEILVAEDNSKTGGSNDGAFNNIKILVDRGVVVKKRTFSEGYGTTRQWLVDIKGNQNRLTKDEWWSVMHKFSIK